jgi:hypothetical protein
MSSHCTTLIYRYSLITHGVTGLREQFQRESDGVADVRKTVSSDRFPSRRTDGSTENIAVSNSRIKSGSQL